MSKITTIIGAFVTLLIFATLVTPLANSIWVNTSATNITGATYVVYSLVTLFFVIVGILLAVKYINQ